MSEKYWVPAIERANSVLKEISQHPDELRLIDLSKKLEINKSSLFSLLNTLEILGWVVKTSSDTYNLGPTLGTFNSMYLSQFNLIQCFYREASKSVSKINEPIQLGVIDNKDVVYLGKVNAKTNVRLVTDPGMRFPAYASAIGKAQMIHFNKEELAKLFSDVDWDKKTIHTTSNLNELYDKVRMAKAKGYSVENEESALGFHCVAAPIYNFEHQIIASVSFSMPTDSWEVKFEAAKDEILNLASRLSRLAGYSGNTTQEGAQ
ncbi:IclR family transcriptional regulator [Peribacillus aracenensis]|uniref:IclR family transcriptional regulator n=1 Tax=Peribacillus aracenensis TaxID=2976708 RepID=UPI0021A5BE7E|nr:IclR family transcriptional regulator [Peribacillus sp. BBB004]